MKKYILTIISLALTLVLALLLFVQPKLQQDELTLETISGDPAFIENQVLTLTYDRGKKEEQSYERRATFYQGETSWDPNKRDYLYEKTLINQAFPIGQRPFSYDDYGNYLTLRPQLYFHFIEPSNYEEGVESLSYQIIDMEKKTFEKHDYQFQNPGFLHGFSSYAVDGDQAYLLMEIYDPSEYQRVGFSRLTLDLNTGQITKNELIDLDFPTYEEIDPEYHDIFFDSAYSFDYVSPSYWAFIRESEDQEENVINKTELIFVDPLTLEEKVVLTSDDTEDLYSHYLYQDQLYYRKTHYEDNGRLTQADLVHYQVDSEEETTLHNTADLDDSMFSFQLIGDRLVIVDRLEDDAHVITLDAKTGQENYQGLVLNSNPELVFLNTDNMDSY